MMIEVNSWHFAILWVLSLSIITLLIYKQLIKPFKTNQRHSCYKNREAIIRKAVIEILTEIYSDQSSSINELKQNKDIDVSKINLQRTKATPRQVFDFQMEKRRSKWELIKALQEEFDKFPDDMEFTSFSAKGVAKGRSVYF